MFRSFLHAYECRCHNALLSGAEAGTTLDAATLLAQIPKSVIERRHRFRPDDTALCRAVMILNELPWHIDEDSTAGLAPALIGQIFERYVERKRRGIYYTGNDVTMHIATRTIVPRLLEALAPAAEWIVTDLIRRNPTRYLPAAAQHGVERTLPPAVAAGLSDVTRRTLWDVTAPDDYALPGETWREVIVRRNHLNETIAALRSGVIDLPQIVTHNLDLIRLMCDLCAEWEASRLNELDTALMNLRVLDPTCGSGAFLCAAFDLLAQMTRIVVERRNAESISPVPGGQRLRAIIEHSLYGVDVMPEAVEICRMSLWLRLAALVDNPDHLRDLRFNIHIGDALTGALYRADDTAHTGGIYDRRSLHWNATFPEVLGSGGFDVIIGNPPYVMRGGLQSEPILREYQTATTGNLYALVIERALHLLRPHGWLGMIVPVASVATESMKPLQRLYAPFRQWHSHYAVRPAKLFPDVDMNLTITIIQKTPALGERYVSGYRRFRARERPHLFETLRYTLLPPPEDLNGALPKLGSTLEVRLLQRMLAHGRCVRDYVTPDGVTIYYHSGGRYWRKALPEKLSSHYKPLPIEASIAPIVLALLNSHLFYWYWIAFSNCMDVVVREVLELPVFWLEEVDPTPFAGMVAHLLTLYREATTTRARRGSRIQTSETNIDARRARAVIAALDRLLARHYGFDDEELDFLLSYDLKYRLGQSTPLTADHASDDATHRAYRRHAAQGAPPVASHMPNDRSQ
ncbi:MAG: HsdM family class I SAM-dependent methyltransferase [Roseiflexus sp.]